jgi:hypothetical protein
MARGVLERSGAVFDALAGLGAVSGRGGGRDDGGPGGSQRPAPPPMQGWRSPKVETPEQQRAAEAERQRHSEQNPRSAPCINCSCMRWLSDRSSVDGTLIWVCAGCRRRWGSAREVLPPAPPAPSLPTAAEARAALAAAVEAVGKAVGTHDTISKAAGSARAAVSEAEQAVEVAEAGLAAAQRDAVVQARRALEAGQAVPAAGLAKVRGEVERASDALLTAKAAAAQIEAKQAEAREVLARTAARADGAALATVAAEIAPALVVRTTALAGELSRCLTALAWLAGRRVLHDPAAHGLLALLATAPRDWAQMHEATETAAALDRALPALVADPAVVVPAP